MDLISKIYVSKTRAEFLKRMLGGVTVHLEVAEIRKGQFQVHVWGRGLADPFPVLRKLESIMSLPESCPWMREDYESDPKS